MSEKLTNVSGVFRVRGEISPIQFIIKIRLMVPLIPLQSGAVEGSGPRICLLPPAQ